MLLETLDILENDILIYSNNRFDLKNNFKIIFKRDKIKRAQNIDYSEVSEFIKEPTPKNLIVYRLLTNNKKLDAFSTKFGYFLKVAGKMELVYFDPIYAIKDLIHLKFDLNQFQFRFKIQQVGFTSSSVINNEADYQEVFSIDLKVDETETQNDSMYAVAIFALDETFVEKLDKEENKLKNLINGEKNIKNKNIDDTDVIFQNIVEDDDENLEKFTKVNFSDVENVEKIRDRNIQRLKDTYNFEWDDKIKKKIDNTRSELKHKSFSKFLANQKIPDPKNKTIRTNDFFKKIKESSSFKNSENRSVVLKLFK